MRSLLAQLLAWLLVPLFALLILNALLSYRSALSSANQAYDRLLAASVRSIADRVAVVDGEITVDVPYVALALFESKSQERIFYRVVSPAGATVTGYDDLPAPPAAPQSADEPVFYRATYHGDTVYFAAVQKPLYAGPEPGAAVVQVGETSEARDALSRAILYDSVARQGLLIVVAALVAWLGLRRGLRPLLRLREEIAARAPTDLTRIDDAGVQTEVRPLVQAINTHMDRLEQLMAARERFIDDASHQLRTPLAALKTQVQYGLGAARPQAEQALLRDIERTTDETIRLVNQLLALARVEPGAGRPTAEVDLRELARDTTAAFVPAARKKRIDLGFDAVEAVCLVNGHRTLLHELIVNLIDNAVRYTPEEGEITVRVARDGDRVRLEVLDNGAGIPAEERERVFQRFYRGQGSASTEGSGLGLAIVSEICRVHGASILLSTPFSGKGLRVSVTFP